jgi:hypothetical protein
VFDVLLFDEKSDVMCVLMGVTDVQSSWSSKRHTAFEIQTKMTLMMTSSSFMTPSDREMTAV